VALESLGVGAAIDALGGLGSPGGSCVWLNFNTGFLELIDLICGFCFSRPAWHYAYGV